MTQCIREDVRPPNAEDAEYCQRRFHAEMPQLFIDADDAYTGRNMIIGRRELLMPGVLCRAPRAGYNMPQPVYTCCHVF